MFSAFSIRCCFALLIFAQFLFGIRAPSPGTASSDEEEVGFNGNSNNNNNAFMGLNSNFNRGRGRAEPGNACAGIGWTRYRNSCYKVVTGDMSFTMAVMQCQRESADAKPVSIGDEAENNFVRTLASPELARVKAQNAARFDLYNSFWIGLQRARVAPGQYQSMWQDGSAVTFGNEPSQMFQTSAGKFPWSNGQPSGTNKWAAPDGLAEECVSMFNQQGNWNDVGCDATLGGAICEKPATSNSVPSFRGRSGTVGAGSRFGEFGDVGGEIDD